MLDQPASEQHGRGNPLPSNGRLRTLLEEVVSNWEQGGAPDAKAALHTFPELAEARSFAIELAYVEFQRRRKSGESVELGQFCGKFPEFQDSLRRVLELDSLLDEDSQSLEQTTNFVWPEPGDILADFEILDELGRGAFSRVFLARQKSLGGRPVALKASVGELLEAETIARLEHPNIVSIHSVHRLDDSAVTLICMPHQGRATLSDVLELLRAVPKDRRTGNVFQDVAWGARRDGDLARSLIPSQPKTCSYVDAVLELGVALAEALQHAHHHGVLHLDLKPSNVLLSFQGDPLVLDFNLSQDTRSRRHRIGGTLPYMSPEALGCIEINTEERCDTLDGRADVFSLGVLLYQLLSVRLPFTPDRSEASLYEGAQRQRRKIELGCVSLCTIAPDVDSAAAAIIERCLSAEPELRPSAEQAAKGLRRCLAPQGRLKRSVLRNPRRALTAGTILLSLIGFGIVQFLNREPPEQQALAAGRSAMQANDWPAAIEHFQTALSLRPDFGEAFLERGRAYARNHQMELALEDFRSANRIRKTPLGLAWQCSLAASLNKFEESIKAGTSYLAEFKPDAGVLNNLGHAYAKLKRYPDAEASLSRAARMENAPVEAYFNRAAIVTQRAMNTPGQPLGAAIAEMRYVVQSAPASGEPYFQLAYLLAGEAAKTNTQNAEVETLLESALQRGMPFDFAKTIPPLSPYISQPRLAQVAANCREDRSRFHFERIVSPR